MHGTLGFGSAILALSSLVSASYRDHPRNYVRSARVHNTSTSTSVMSSSSYPGPSISAPALTSSTSLGESLVTSLTSSIDTTISRPSSCLGSVTYYSSAPPTVYVTTTIPFTVTVTAANVSLITPPIYTPPPPCFQSIVPPAVTTKCVRNCPLNSPNVGETLTGSAYTSTVVVTKKTPVPTVVPDTSAPPNYHIPSTTPTPAPGGQPGSSNPAVQSPTPPPNSPGSNGANANSLVPGPAKTPGNDGSQPTTGAAANSPAPIGGPTVIPNIGSAANSGVNGVGASTPAADKGTAGSSGPTPTTANVNGVPVIVLPSSSGVVVGGQIVSIPPSGSQTTVVANGNTFTLAKSSIVGPGTTIALAADEAGVSPTPVTANGLTFKVGATQAIISGSTYAIGAGAPTTTLTLGSQTLVVGPSGVGVPGQTIAPEKATAGPSMSVVTAGGVTITYGKSEAIVGSSTYRIGQGASPTFITLNGKTISLGANGLGLASSTIPLVKITAAPSLSAVTVDGMSFSLDATEVVIGSSTFRIGPGAPTETTIIDGKTISIGPSGVGLRSTTVHPPSATTGLQSGAAASLLKKGLLSSFVIFIMPSVAWLSSCLI